ncbi:alanine racemase [Vermiculatibacterium agrestimuris]|uniref:alanine racemase n=1 Tax=Vermiculatibacterium agrestimuris TaxID=2941519 RepID=UPI00203D8D73|nr:alanine racemase [Vermiculatibacterium agrestimuris]
MEEKKSYPRLLCDLGLLERNANEVTRRCHDQGIRVAGVVKGINSQRPMVERFARGGCDQLASSRLSQLAAFADLGLPTMLIRVPMRSEVEGVVRLADYSLQSDRAVLDAVEAACERQGKTHKVILMADLGDLREGWWDKEELVQAALHVEKELPHVILAGIGTNLGCYGAIKPTVEKMEELAELAEKVETAVGRELEIVSGGATTSYLLVHRHEMPKKINHLRVGEGILLCYDFKYEWGVTDIEYLSSHVFTLQTEVVECRSKPSYPVGEIFVDAFGGRPTYEDRGVRRRALIGIGKLDMGSSAQLIPREEGITYLGGASDLTILDVEECPRQLQAGDILEFDISYSEMAFLTAAADVTVEYIG